MALTSDQLTDFRGDIGDDGTLFTDDELNRLYTRASESYSSAVVLAFRQIMASAVKMTDYQIVHSMEKKSQVFEHIKALLTYWEDKVVSASQQIAIIGMAVVPPSTKDEPIDDTQRRVLDQYNSRR